MNLKNITTTAWLLALGYLGFYAYGLIMGVYTPAQMWGFTAVAAAVTVAVGIRGYVVHKEMREHGAGELMREVHRFRETRGF